jgi:hypothetical protein
MPLDLAVEDLSAHLISRMLLSPTLWSRYQVTATQLRWRKTTFDRANIRRVPARRGVYALLIRNRTRRSSWPRHGYIMYVGIAGRDPGSRTLRDRFGEYLTPSGVARRPKVARLVRTWGDHLDFNYAVVAPRVNLKTLETQLLGAIVPPCNRADLPAEIRPAVDAFL